MKANKKEQWDKWKSYFTQFEDQDLRATRERLEAEGRRFAAETAATYEQWLKDNGYERDAKGVVICKCSGNPPAQPLSTVAHV